MPTIYLHTYGKFKSLELKIMSNHWLTLANRKSQKKFNIDVLKHKDVDASKAISLSKIVKAEDINLAVSFFLAEYGQQFDTGELHRLIEKKLIANGDIHFWIANAWGWDRTNLSDDQSIVKFLSLSKLTFSHELAIAMFTEQLFRYADLKAGGSYAK